MLDFNDSAPIDEATIRSFIEIIDGYASADRQWQWRRLAAVSDSSGR